MNNTPLFSILISNYNNGKYLKEAIESVINQTYSNWEIILIDDGSIDNSHEIYKFYNEERRIKVFYNGKNKGCGYTKHRCAKLANGEICGFLDSDDVIFPTAIEDMVNMHIKFPSCSLIDSLLYPYINGQIIEQPSKYIKDSDLVLSKRWSIVPFATFKSSLYKKTVGINRKLKLAVDTDMYYLLEEVGEIQHIDKPLYLYRQDNINSICQGTDGVKAFLYRSIAAMNAITRRRKKNDKFFNEHVSEYRSAYRYWLSYYMKHSNIVFDLKYIYNYWILNNYSPIVLKHLLKIYIK